MEYQRRSPSAISVDRLGQSAPAQGQGDPETRLRPRTIWASDAVAEPSNPEQLSLPPMDSIRTDTGAGRADLKPNPGYRALRGAAVGTAAGAA
jgi:hypothetical protein